MLHAPPAEAHSVDSTQGETVKSLCHRIRRMISGSDGPTVTEYAVMIALIILLVIVSLAAMGGKISSVFTTVNSGLPGGG